LKLLVAVLAALIAAVGVGHLVATHPGIVAISVEGKVFRLSLALFCVLTLGGTLLALFLLRALYRVLTIRRRYRRWRAERARRRAQLALNDGLLALAAGDYASAERTLQRGAQISSTPVHYLAAAQAAHALHAPARRDAYLALADDGSAALPVGLRRVEMLLDEGELGAAERALQPLLERHGKAAQVLRLRHRLLASQSRWDELVALLPALRRHKVFAEAHLAEMEAELAARRLAQPMVTLVDAQEIWRALSKPAREQSAVLLAHARALLRLEAGDEAESLLRKALGRHWDPRLVALYAELDVASPAALLGRAEAWLATRPDDPQLLLTLGRLGYRAALWGKARAYLEEAIARHPSALGHRLLADVYDRLDEPVLAQRQRALGLELATGGASGLLPAP
jgi:HemY protein